MIGVELVSRWSDQSGCAL